MKLTQDIMGMPITIEVVDKNVREKDINEVFDYFKKVDEKFSTYKKTSEISKINNGMLQIGQSSVEMKEVLALCEETKKETNGYFDIKHNGKLDPSGIVKGWAILNASKLLEKKGVKNFYVDAGGDIQVKGKNSKDTTWKVGIKNPFNESEIIKVLEIKDLGVATSGTYIRGQHIYNPLSKNGKIEEIVSLTVVGTNIYEADRFATAAFAMGKQGINFIENLKNFEGYMIDNKGTAIYTSGFEKFAA